MTIENKEVFGWLRNLFSMKIILTVIFLQCLFNNALCDSIQPPTFLSEINSKEYTVAEGNTVILECQAFGIPPPQYQWQKNGVTTSDYNTKFYHKVSSAARGKGDVYRCLVNNSAGTILTASIRVFAAYFDQPQQIFPIELHVPAGEAAVLHLPEIRSYPMPKISWLMERSGSVQEGDRFSIGEPNKELVILETTKADEGIYSATISNMQVGREIVSRPIHLIIQEEYDYSTRPLEIVIPPANTTVLEGTSFTKLRCIANARPLSEVEVFWHKDGVPIVNSGVRSFLEDRNRSLTLLQASLSYTGRYSCIAKFRGTQQEAEAYLRVEAPPMIKTQLSKETKGDLGSSLVLNCVSFGYPTPTLSWLKDGIDVNTIMEFRYRVMSNGSLVISSVMAEDSAIYQCLSSNAVGEAATYTWLTVRTSAPVILDRPTNQTVLDGEDVLLRCTAEGAPHPNITWTFNGSELSSDATYHVETNGALKITGARVENEGIYECTRTNSADKVTASAVVSIIVKTIIVEAPQDVRVTLGHVATFTCKASYASSVEIKVKWFHDGDPLGHAAGRINVSPDGTLVIQEVRATDSGVYTCQVLSHGGNDTRSARLQVIELPYAPVDVKAERVQNSQPTVLGIGPRLPNTIKVSWNAPFDGNDPVRRFEVEHREVPQTGPFDDDLGLNWISSISNVTGDSSSVLIKGMKASTAYKFRVSAVNGVGRGPPSQPSKVLLLPQEAPTNPPRRLVGSARSSSEIMIQWEAPSRDSFNGVLLGYLVRYRLSGYTDSRWYYRNVTNSNQVSYLIGGLITWKSYEIEVAAYNRKGVGVFSIPLLTSTKEGVPEGPPRQLEARAIGSDVVHVEWTAPQPYLINGINQGYKVQAWKGLPDEDSVPPVTMKVTPSPYPNAREKVNLTSLEKFTNYYVTVLCFTNPGDGPRSEPVEVTTKEDVPGEVTDLTVSDITHRSMILHWAPPGHQNGVLKGYTASIVNVNDISSRKDYNLTADITSMELANLTSLTNYTLNVFAWTSVGYGEFSRKLVSTAVEPVLPDAPSRLAVSNIQTSSVVLQFTPGFDGNALIEKYTIEVKPGRSSSWTTHETVEGHAGTASSVVANLTPYTEYQLRLRAHNAAGPSDPSSPSPPFQTLHADPAHGPTDVRVRAVSATELRVRWVPLQQNEWHGVPRGYSLKYRPTDCITACSASTAFVDDVAANSYTLSGLEEYTLYDVTVQAVNDVGFSFPQSPPIQEKTQESAPSAGPSDIAAEATSSTTVVVRWGNVPKGHINGIIRGFKVIYGGRGLPPQVAQIDDNTTQSTTLTELRKYYNYSIQVRAFTRSGDGSLSMPPVIVQTMEDVPGPPSNVSFPDVSFTYARVIWNLPKEPNGEIIGYSVTHSLLTGGRQNNVTVQLGPEDRTYKAIDLHAESNYVFIIRAKGNLGWGTERIVHVYTTAHRQKPVRPTRPSVGASQITSTSISLSWAVEDDGYAPIRYYEIEQRQEIADAPWISVFVHSSLKPPLSPVYNAVDLRPATPYSFRVRAANDVGLSEWSLSSLVTMTQSSAPKMFPKDVKIVPITRSDVRVSWTPLDIASWNGDVRTAGYSFAYKDAASPLAPALIVDATGADKSQIVIQNLEKNKNYEITVWSYNAKGKSPRSSPYSFFVGEAVPTGRPEDVQAQPLSPREIKISWTAPRKELLNGQLLGYKIFYKEANHTGNEEVEIVKPEGTNYNISYLQPFTTYNVTMLCFNPAGEGPLSDAVTITTLESAPQAVENLRFDDITMTSLKVSWDQPPTPNGHIRGYLVTYETARPDENFSKQVKQKVSSSQLIVESLKEEVTYKFHVRAETVSLGPAKSATVTTGPQPGSPARPKDVRLSQTVSSVTVHWRNNHPGQSPILGYYIQTKELASDGWTTIMRTSGGPAEEYAIAFQNLMPSTTYEFRLSAYNAQGISHPTFIDQKIVTPSKVVLQLASPHHQPFYHQTWFVVSLAAGSMVVIITVVATLCVKSSAYKYKNDTANKTMDSNLTLNEPSYEMRSVHRSSAFPDQTIGCMGTSLSNSASAIAGARIPPRPAPASVTYSDDDTMKGYDDDADESSDVSEKPTDVSSTDTDESPDEAGAAAPSFVNHYANLNSTMRSSWQRQRPMRNYSNYTDSEAEGSGVVSLNGGQVVLNNMAGSRAPLPGFSSFV